MRCSVVHRVWGVVWCVGCGVSGVIYVVCGM